MLQRKPYGFIVQEGSIHKFLQVVLRDLLSPQNMSLITSANKELYMSIISSNSTLPYHPKKRSQQDTINFKPYMLKV